MTCELFTYEVNGIEYQRVKFVTLTMRNGICEEDQESAYRYFFWKLACRSRCHIHYEWGIERGNNAHAHFSVAVPSCEIGLWKKNLKRFRPYVYWSGKSYTFSDYVAGRKTDSYIRKHKYMGYDHICPKVWACRDLDVCRFGARNIY